MKKRLILSSIIALALVLILYFSFKPLDLTISNNISKLWNPVLNLFFIAITFIGNSTSMIFLTIILLAILLFQKRTRDAVFSAVFIGGTALLVEILKLIFNRVRPLNNLIPDSGTSFPSSHATVSIVFFLLLIYLFKDKIKNKSLKLIFTAVCVILIILIAFSRIYLNVHYLSDVLAGVIIGLFCFFIFKSFNKK